VRLARRAPPEALDPRPLLPPASATLATRAFRSYQQSI
jgi:hypothetical protein